MKKLFSLLAITLQMVMAHAQELTVTYQAVYNSDSPDLFATAGLNEQMRSSLANAYKDVVMNYRLKFKDNESEYRLIPGEGKQEITFMGQTIDVNAAALAQAQNYTYKNHNEGVILDKTSVFGKEYIVVDSIRSSDFTEVKGEKKIILGFECIKAVSSDKKTTIWYTPHIPLKDEPIACGLNGLVLQFDNGQQTYTATEINDVVEGDIIKPTEGKVINKADFTEMVNKRVEMMKRN
ncbi:MAG: GLPGLI family protein [Bacteroidaceae bacterium]|jgi:GLPGLI family protein|nr:GLPGLI family protein [Bacteroidaceae bacterium]MBP5480006.1 GLPGLI family protein [Bacteroidaceae bacterium]